MKIFPHRLAQEEGDPDLQVIMSDLFGKHLYTVGTVNKDHISDICEWCRKNNVHMQYAPLYDGYLCRIPEKDLEKLEDGERGKYIMFTPNNGYPVYPRKTTPDIAENWISA